MTLRRALRWGFGLPITVVAVAFAVANRQWTTVSLDPISSGSPWISIAMPLWALFFCGAFAGILAGWLACWMAQGKWRRMSKSLRTEIASARAENDSLRQEAERRALLPTHDGPAG